MAYTFPNQAATCPMCRGMAIVPVDRDTACPTCRVWMLPATVKGVSFVTDSGITILNLSCGHSASVGAGDTVPPDGSDWNCFGCLASLAHAIRRSDDAQNDNRPSGIPG